MIQDFFKKKNRWIKISSRKIFHIWDKYKNRFFIEVICPFCFEITFIWFETKNNRLHLNCTCEIPRNPTPKDIEIKLANRK